MNFKKAINKYSPISKARPRKFLRHTRKLVILNFNIAKISEAIYILGMIEQFDTLENDALDIMFKAPILVCILIAGADGTIDKREIKEAISLALKQAKSQTSLASYFTEVAQDFEDKLKVLIQGYPHGAAERTPIIINELAKLNAILPRLDSKFSIQFYAALKSIAAKIASSSGGLLGLNSVGQEEGRFVNLEMIKDPTYIQ